MNTMNKLDFFPCVNGPAEKRLYDGGITWTVYVVADEVDYVPGNMVI